MFQELSVFPSGIKGWKINPDLLVAWIFGSKGRISKPEITCYFGWIWWPEMILCQLGGDPVFTMHGQALCKWKCLHWVLGMFATSCYLCGFGPPTIVGPLASIVACHASPMATLSCSEVPTCLCSTSFISFNKRRWTYSPWSLWLSFFLPFFSNFWNNLKLKKTIL